MTPETQEKRNQLAQFVQKKLTSVDAVQGVIAIGSIASGMARTDSDIDVVIFLDPFDLYIVPAEATWRESDDSWHSIFDDVDGLELDFQRLDWAVWKDPAHHWPEPFCAELGSGWLAFDRHGEIEGIIGQRTTYDDRVRVDRLDEAVTWLDQHLGEGAPQKHWHALGPVIAHDRLLAAYEWLTAALFAMNRQWRTWRNREMTALLQLTWLPPHFEQQVMAITTMASPSYDDYMGRVNALNSLFADVLKQLQVEGFYGADPIGEAFIRSHNEPGRAWNITEWQSEHKKRWEKPER